jgi:hypothetical protein
MYISLEDSCTKDFSKWPGVYHLEIAKDVRADKADGDVAGDTDLDNRVMDITRAAASAMARARCG